MKSLKCLVVDDEPVGRKIIREFILKTSFLSLAGEAENTTKATSLLRSVEVDLIFLDIEMPKMSGLEWLKQASPNQMVILVTAFPNYALEGFELDVIDYLLKPVSYNRFTKAAQKAAEYHSLSRQSNLSADKDWLFVRTDKRIEKIELSDILYVESTGNYVNIITAQKSILAYLTLKAVEAQLPKTIFTKVHHSFLVNFSKIDAIEGNILQVKTRQVPISRNYREPLMKMVEDRLLKR